MNHQGQDFSEYSAEFSMAERLCLHWDKQAAVSVWAAAFPAAAEPAGSDNTSAAAEQTDRHYTAAGTEVQAAAFSAVCCPAVSLLRHISAVRASGQYCHT